MNYKKLLWWLPTIAYIIAIIAMAARPAPRLPVQHIDKTIHFLAYALLAMLLYVSLSRSQYRNPAIWAVFIAIATGITDEYVQSFSRFRDASVMDLLADTAGAIVGSLLAFKFSALIPRRD